MTDFSAVINFVKNARLPNDEEKKIFIQMLEKGEPFPEEFIMAFQSFLEEELEALTVEEGKLKEDLARKHQELVQVSEENFPKKKKVLLEAREVFQGIAKKFQHDLDSLADEQDKKVETVVRREGDESEISAIRSSLQKPKPEDTADAA